MNMINKLVSAGIVFTFTAVFPPSIVQSEEAPVRGPAPFSAYDEDGSGSISEDEFDALHKKRVAARAAAGGHVHGAANPPSFSDFDTND
ncbi:MAG: hypothetical protein K9M17_06205, partial [Mariprofundaceae bacterium]|nr:hypothetical protein [Mariprofundaceae bacterium]